jgi:hypothetical protein
MPRPKKHKQKFIFLLMFLVFANLSLTGCVNMVDFENSQVFNQEAIGRIGPAETLGQTISVQRTPISGIYLWIRPGSDTQEPDSQLVFRIFEGETTDRQIYAGQVPYSHITDNFPVYITFPPVDVMVGQKIYLQLESTGAPLWVYGRNEDAYPGGEAYLNGSPQNADVAFRLVYSYDVNSFLADLRRMLPILWLIIPLGLLLLIPGWLALSLSGTDRDFDLVCRLGIMLGVSLAILPVVVTWTSLFQLHWNRLTVIGIYLLLGLLTVGTALWRRRRKRSESLEIQQDNETPTAHVKSETSTLLLMGLIFLGVLVIRFAMVRDLSAPAWVDAVHHALLARIIQTNGMIPANFLPYANVQPAYYHTGFHVSLAFFGWLSGLEIADASLIFGQLLNAAIVFPVYLLAYTLTRNRTAGLVAALVTGFVTPMPAYYTSWSRYTQLAGLMILPAGFALLRPLYTSGLLDAEIVDQSLRKRLIKFWPWMILSAVTLGGLFLVHYRVAAFFICLLAADYLYSLPGNWKVVGKYLWITLPSLVITAIAGALFAAPIFLPVVGRLLPQRAAERAPETIEPNIEISFSFLTAGLGKASLIVAGVGLVVAFIRQFRVAGTLIVWTALMFFLANSEKLGLPTRGLVSNDSVVITLFLPISIAIGYLFGLIYDAIQKSTNSSGRWAVDLGFIAGGTVIAIIGARTLLPIINPTTVFFRAADRTAARWIEENLPLDTSFLINPAPWGYGIFIGSDGGYWISPLTGRLTFPPTLLYAHGNLDDVHTINSDIKQLMNILDQPDQISQFMQAHQIQYLYLGQNGGPISPQAVLQSSQFDPIYHQDGVWIFQIQSNP